MQLLLKALSSKDPVQSITSQSDAARTGVAIVADMRSYTGLVPEGCLCVHTCEPSTSLPEALPLHDGMSGSYTTYQRRSTACHAAENWQLPAGLLRVPRRL